MKPTYVNPEELGKPVGFSHGVMYAGGRILFLGGQNGGSGTFAAQFEAALQRILAVVRTSGGKPEHIACSTFSSPASPSTERQGRRSAGSGSG